MFAPVPAVPAGPRRWGLVAVALLALGAPEAASAASRYEQAVQATPGLQRYLRLGDSGAVVDVPGGRRVTSSGVPTPFCEDGPSYYGDQIALGQPGALAGDPDTAAGFDGATPDAIWGSSFRVSCGPNDGWSWDAPFTMEAWIKPDRLDGNSRRVLSRENEQGGTLVAARTDGLVFSRYLRARRGVPARAATLKAPVARGVWTHVVAAYDGASMRLIVDGRLAAQVPTNITLSNSILHVGANPQGYLEWDGLIDEVATYSANVTVAQAAAHHAAGSAAR